MRRSSQPIEILLGFAAGAVTAFFIQLPLIWLLHELHLTDERAYSSTLTMPLGVEFVWSRVFWGGVFGVVLATFGTRYELGLRYIVATSLFTFVLRTLAEWLVEPLFARAGSVASIGQVLIALFVNALWVPATAVLVIGLSLAAGTWGAKAPTDLWRRE
jgi:hypothetical protein